MAALETIKPVRELRIAISAGHRILLTIVSAWVSFSHLPLLEKRRARNVPASVRSFRVSLN
jgi:hypothetical protein